MPCAHCILWAVLQRATFVRALVHHVSHVLWAMLQLAAFIWWLTEKLKTQPHLKQLCCI